MPEQNRLQLPLRPAGGSLAAHVAALDLLAARIESLPGRSKWPVRVPINSKASFGGSIVHTNEAKVFIGRDEWVEMSASEAAEYIRGRKAALLEDQARITEGQQPLPVKFKAKDDQQLVKTKDIKFDSLFARPGPLPRFIPRKVEDSNLLTTPMAADPKESIQALVDLVGENLKEHLHIPDANENEQSEVNEEGLPIHEIREDFQGNTLGAMPEPSGDGDVTLDEKDDYWSPEAIARRAALRRQLFEEGSDGEDETEEDDDAMDVQGEIRDATANSDDSSVHTEQPQASKSEALAPFSGSMVREVTPPMSGATSSLQQSPATQPRSILKSPKRKKSVSFDAGTKLPAESPQLKPVKLGFPLNDMVTEMPIKGVPIIPPPKPGKGFGGLRPGFLAASSNSSDSAEPIKTEKLKGDEPPVAPELKKKPSLFAQRRAEPSLPKLRDSKPMATMKNAVVETPVSSAPTTSGSRSAQFPPAVGSATALHTSSTPSIVVDADDSDPDDYGDLGEFSDDEEDEYALDEALLAREVALEFHRRQAWQKPVDDDEIDLEADTGAVLGIPRVSSVTGGTEDDPLRIVNPTPDDLSQFLRVGRDADGQLVFEQPLVDSGSESEGDEEESQEKKERRARREETMRRLLAGDYEDIPAQRDAEAEQKDREKQWASSLPPTVQPTSPMQATALPVSPPSIDTQSISSIPAKHDRDEVERVKLAEAPMDEQSEAPAPPKKVSRFKAARQGL